MFEIKILYEDNDILVVSKPTGVIVNRADTAAGSTTLQDWAEAHTGIKQSSGDSDFYSRAGIVHRLDRETSGVLVLAKTENAFVNLQAQFKSRVVQKKYIALVHGSIPNDSGVVEASIARIGAFGKFGIDESGRESKTEYSVDARFSLSGEKIDQLVSENDLKLNKNRVSYLKNHANLYSLLSVLPKTGRTHQIRVHMKSEGYPLVSDLIYDPAKLLKFDLLWCPRLFLHAERISFKHPSSGETVEFSVELPRDLQSALKYLAESSS
ncbi:MAG TPA: RluA family pseudouridine synthase [Patescibacteria group bacterium]|nr:RluA family pseudouridine synthase [Patescibacteria group bacterium]